MADRFGAPREILRSAITHLAFPCAVVEVGDSTRPLWSESVGHLTFGVDSPAVATDTIFDLASLTKVLSTAPLLMRAVDQGLVGLDDPVGDHIPEWRGAGRATVTLRDLLSHASGLPAHRPYYKDLTGRGQPTCARAIAAEPLEYEPRTKSIYSDLGFMLLGFILDRDRALVKRFDSLKAETAPADDLQFHPPGAWLKRTAPTEINSWRGRLLRGAARDKNPLALGGGARHAGVL